MSVRSLTDCVADAETAAAYVAANCGSEPADIAVVLGSGLGAFADALEGAASVSMTDLPYFPTPTVPGHAGKIVVGQAGDKRVMVLAGRAHLYEGNPVNAVVHGVRTAIAYGAKIVVLTNAAGGIKAGYRVGELVALSDHINLTGANPLTGAPLDDRTSFVDCSALYSPRMRELALQLQPTMQTGVYAAMAGPSYETPAEIRYLQAIGADLAGMSTVCEAIAARHLGAEVSGFSLVTNLAAGLGGELSHEEVAAAGAAAASNIVDFLTRLVAAA